MSENSEPPKPAFLWHKLVLFNDCESRWENSLHFACRYIFEKQNIILFPHIFLIEPVIFMLVAYTGST